MSYDLIPKNKNVNELRVGSFSWPIFLQETGAGYVLGYGQGRTMGSYVYQQGNKGSPVSNDGYKVTSTEAKMIAKILRGFVSVQRYVNKEWEAIPEADREFLQKQKVMDYGTPLYRGTWHEDRLKEMEKIAEFAEQSKGFTIN